MLLKIMVPLISACLLAGCGGGGNVKKDAGVPGWLLKPPREKGRICAVGASEPTYYAEDAKEVAAENARKELARTIRVAVSSVMVDDSGSRSSSNISETSSWATSAVLEKSEIADYWRDVEGMASFGRKGVTYALACMPAP